MGKVYTSCEGRRPLPAPLFIILGLSACHCLPASFSISHWRILLSSLDKSLFACLTIHFCGVVHPSSLIHSFGHFYSPPSSLLLLRGAPDYSTDTVSEFHAKAPQATAGK